MTCYSAINNLHMNNGRIRITRLITFEKYELRDKNDLTANNGYTADVSHSP